MPSAVISDYRELLEAKLNELSTPDSNRAAIVIGDATDEVDRLQQQLSRELAISQLERQSHFLKSIESALQRIREDTYAVCLNCGEPIPENRLKALPWAEHCVSCQETIDRLQATHKVQQTSCTIDVAEKKLTKSCRHPRGGSLLSR